MGVLFIGLSCRQFHDTSMYRDFVFRRIREARCPRPLLLTAFLVRVVRRVRPHDCDTLTRLSLIEFFVLVVACCRFGKTEIAGLPHLESVLFDDCDNGARHSLVLCAMSR